MPKIIEPKLPWCVSYNDVIVARLATQKLAEALVFKLKSDTVVASIVDCGPSSTPDIRCFEVCDA